MFGRQKCDHKNQQEMHVKTFVRFKRRRIQTIVNWPFVNWPFAPREGATNGKDSICSRWPSGRFMPVGRFSRSQLGRSRGARRPICAVWLFCICNLASTDSRMRASLCVCTTKKKLAKSRMTDSPLTGNRIRRNITRRFRQLPMVQISKN